MLKSLYDERLLEVLGASCVNQSQEIVNLFFTAMKTVITTKRIERVLDYLRQRYGFCNGLTTEPEIAKIHFIESVQKRHKHPQSLRTYP